MSTSASDNFDRSLDVAVGMSLVPGVERVERLNTRAAEKGLEATVVEDVGRTVFGFNVRLAEGGPLRNGDKVSIAKKVLALMRLDHDFRVCEHVHVNSSFLVESITRWIARFSG
jgi:hypothetical protein